MHLAMKQKARQASVHAVVTRANGTVEDLGMIAYYHKNPLRRWTVNAMIWFKRRVLHGFASSK